MRLIRRSPAALVAASLFILAACGSEPAPTSTTPPEADPLVGPNLDFALSRTEIGFNYNTVTKTMTPMAAGANSSMVTGIIALASIANPGAPQYLPAVPGWLTVQRTPAAQQGGWRLTMLPSGINLAEGVYTARVPVTVPGARNNPQMITVTMVVCNTSNCLGAGSFVEGSLSGTDGTWDRGGNLAAPGGFYYDDYRLFVGPNQTVTVEMWGSSCSKPYSHNDVYLYAFFGGVLETANDDWCGLNSLIHVTNPTGAIREYVLRSTSYSGGAQGTYAVKVRNGAHSNSIRLDEPQLPIDEFSPEYLELKRQRAAGN